FNLNLSGNSLVIYTIRKEHRYKMFVHPLKARYQLCITAYYNGLCSQMHDGIERDNDPS
ncbi:Hypothetical predicted protein, partial [Paramuricea clavata]